MGIIPMVISNDGKNNERFTDIYSCLLNNRIIFLSGEINDALASNTIASLLYLESIDDKKDITIYINSPGGSVTSGMAIIDTMNYIKPDVSTICIGLTASMGAMILSQGTKDKRYVLKNSEVMIHQPLGGTRGQATDIELYAKNIGKIKERLCNMLSEATCKDIEAIKRDIERDFWMDSNEAVEYGIVDKII